MAQLADPPALTDLYDPAGGLLWPWPLSPQHRSVPLAAIAQLCESPVLNAT